MAEKIVKKKTFWLATSLVMLSLLVWAHNFTIAGDSPATSITVGNDAPTITSVEINTLQALEVSNDIAYASLLPGQNSSQSWVTTTATSTGNKIIDIKFHGGSLTKTDDATKHIPAFRQQFTTTSNLTYGDATAVWLATSTGVFTGDVHDVTMVKATNTVPYPSSADNILWGIGIPSGQLAGTYASTTYFIVADAIVGP